MYNKSRLTVRVKCFKSKMVQTSLMLQPLISIGGHLCCQHSKCEATLTYMIKASSHIDDTTRQHTTRPIFSLTIQSYGSVHTYAARQCLVITTKSCDNKNCSGTDFRCVSQ